MKIYIDPDNETLENMKKKQNDDIEKKKLLLELKGKENITLDGTSVNIYANIGSVDNIGAVLLNDAGGIGLFRGEFLYLESSDYPSEEVQLMHIKRFLRAWQERRLLSVLLI